MTLPELVVTATPADVGYKADTAAGTGKTIVYSYSDKACEIPEEVVTDW